jgi:hypothetical protein
MNAEKEIVCGADIHSDFLVATMISQSGLKLQEQFDKIQDDLLAFRSRILDYRCIRVLCVKIIIGLCRSWSYIVVGPN